MIHWHLVTLLLIYPIRLVLPFQYTDPDVQQIEQHSISSKSTGLLFTLENCIRKFINIGIDTYEVTVTTEQIHWILPKMDAVLLMDIYTNHNWLSVGCDNFLVSHLWNSGDKCACVNPVFFFSVKFIESYCLLLKSDAKNKSQDKYAMTLTQTHIDSQCLSLFVQLKSNIENL